MATLNDLIPEILLEADGCPNLLAARALRRAGRKFCKESGYWREELSLLSLADNTPSYDLTGALPADSEIDGILSVVRESDGEALKDRSPLQLENDYSDWRNERGDPEVYTQFSPTALRIVPYPTTTTDSLRIFARLIPVLTATTLPDMVLNRYGEGIFAGAVAELLRVPNKPWSNATRAADFEDWFKVEWTKAKSEAERFFSRRRTGTVRYGGL